MGKLDQTMEQALAILVPGVVFRVFKKANPSYAVCHVRAVVDNEYIVYRVWNARKGWVYRIQYAFYFGLLIEEGDLSVVRKGSKKARKHDDAQTPA